MKTAAKQQWVATGELVVTTDVSVELMTVTSSGVAVVVYSTNPPVLGLAHVVLSSDAGGRLDPQRPAVYAGQGTRMLIQKMLAVGARASQMRASLVGGADMLGRDEARSTGRRNIEAVKQAMSELGIRVAQTHTGGNEGLRLRVAVQDGKIHTQPTPSIAKQLVRKSAGWNPPPKLRREILNNLEQLRCDSGVSAGVAKAMRKDEVDWPSVIESIGQDPIFTMSVLRLANSVYYGRPGCVSCVADGLKVLKAPSMGRICLQVANESDQGLGLEDLGITRHRFVSHAQATARIAKSHALKHRPDLAGMTETAALLHGLRPVVASLASGRPNDAQYVSGRRPDMGRGIEARLWGQITASILLEWNFPHDLVRAVAGPGAAVGTTLGASLEKLIVSCCALACREGQVDGGLYRCPWPWQLASG
jgi:chemotaxis receptor (MCP) glutamine deamidase CheD/HD-like signal output (HDOD) protein